ncbi:MAG: CapA family protein [Lachnospiraceae bacterium]|nr:CapA family protein [Lachnospiraceae bacterium]
MKTKNKLSLFGILSFLLIFTFLVTALSAPSFARAEDSSDQNVTVETDAEEDEEVIRQASPLLSDKKIILKPGKKHTLSVEDAEGLKITWNSSDPDVATVSKKGRVTAVSEGKATVSAHILVPKSETKFREVTLKCKVTVEAVKEVRIAAVGDVLFHDRVIASGKKSDGSYNYDNIFSATSDYFHTFDVTIANQETPFTDDPSKYKGYPSFGTPTALGDSMIKAGINVVTCATNHSWDQGSNGIKVTVDYWNAHKDDAIMLGMHKTEHTFQTIHYKRVNGVKIAFINFTTFLNSSSGIKTHYVNILKSSTYNEYGGFYGSLTEEKLFEKIKKAASKADFVIVLPHWGVEYTHVPTKAQQKLAQKMADAGADAIIGCHPHVVMPLKIIDAADGRRVPCYYSLGNFVSNMSQAERNLEGIAELTLTKWNGETTIKNAEFKPLINHISGGETRYCVYLLSDYTDELAAVHSSNYLYGKGTITIKKLNDLFNSIGNEKWK